MLGLSTVEKPFLQHGKAINDIIKEEMEKTVNHVVLHFKVKPISNRLDSPPPLK